MEYKENVYAHLKKMQDDECQGKIKENILTTINSLEKTRISLYKMLNEYIEIANYAPSLLGEKVSKNTIKQDDIDRLRFPNVNVIEYNDKLVLETSHIPVNMYSKSIMSEFLQEQQYLQIAIMHVLKNYKNKYNYNKAFIMFNLISPMVNYDMDNRFFKPYIDAIVDSKILGCDCVKYMSFGFQGTYSEDEFKMKITIKNYYDIEKYLE